MAAFDNPATGFESGRLLDGTDLFTATSDVRGEAKFFRQLTHLTVVVALVEAEALRSVARGLGPRDDDALERLTRQLEVVAVRPGDDDGEGDAVGLGQQAALGSALRSVGGVGAGFFPPRAAPSSSRRPLTASASPPQQTRRSPPGPSPKPSRRRPPRSIPRSAGAPTSLSRCPSPSVRSTDSPCAARTGSPSSRPDRARAGCDTRVDAACPAELTARSAPTARPECATHHHAPQGPCSAKSPEPTSMENFSATIGRRWTFMEHMELPAYRDGLLATTSTSTLGLETLPWHSSSSRLLSGRAPQDFLGARA